MSQSHIEYNIEWSKNIIQHYVELLLSMYEDIKGSNILLQTNAVYAIYCIDTYFTEQLAYDIDAMVTKEMEAFHKRGAFN